VVDRSGSRQTTRVYSYYAQISGRDRRLDELCLTPPSACYYTLTAVLTTFTELKGRGEGSGANGL